MDGHLVFDYDNYLFYKYSLPEALDEVSCLYRVNGSSTANIFVQFNWCDEDDVVIERVYGSRIVDQKNNAIYFRASKPEKRKNAIRKLEIIARPNPHECFSLDHVKICAWKKIP